MSRRFASAWFGVALLALLALLATTARSAPTDLADTARFLAGQGAGSDASLAEHARAPSYADYAAQIGSGWRQFQQSNLEHMRTWWAGHAPATYATVFYPFSGPDIANALALFPDADSYLLFGLEPPGTIPDLERMDEQAIRSGLDALSSSLSEMFEVNYFFTNNMKKKLGNGPFNSISGVLLFLLATSDCEVIGANQIAIARGGALVRGTAADGARVPGVEITFRRNGGKQQTIRYFMVDVADGHLANGGVDFLAYVDGQGSLVTMIKSASYLLQRAGIQDPAHFDRIRALVLGHSDFVVQDDSGLPLRSFSRDAWKLRFHGRYEAPTPEFGKYLQHDLKVEMQRNSTGRLPFSYGYAYKQGESNLMTAERAR